MGDLVERRIFRIVADPATYQNGQIGFDPSNDSDLGFKMFCGRDGVGAITKMLAKDKPARVQSFRILNGQFSWNFNEVGDVGTLSVANSVTSLGKLEFSDDLLTAGGIKARFADSAAEASTFLSDFGNTSIMGAMSWFKSNPISGLNEDQLVFGKDDGTIDQSASLTFNDSELVIGSGDEKLSLAWDLIIGGTSLSIGQGNGHNSPFADKLVVIGNNLIIDASSGFFIGSTIDAESHYSSAVGTNLTVAHDYAMARGRYVTTMATGARHFGMDRYNSVDGTAQGIDGLILVGESIGNVSIDLHDAFSSSSTSIVIPDGIMAVLEVELISSIFDADSSSNGYLACSRRIIIWNNAGYAAWDYETANQLEIASHNAGWTSTISVTANGIGGFNIRVVVSGLSGGTEVLTHVANVRGFTSQTSMIKSS